MRGGSSQPKDRHWAACIEVLDSCKLYGGLPKGKLEKLTKGASLKLNAPCKHLLIFIIPLWQAAIAPSLG